MMLNLFSGRHKEADVKTRSEFKWNGGALRRVEVPGNLGANGPGVAPSRFDPSQISNCRSLSLTCPSPKVPGLRNDHNDRACMGFAHLPPFH